MIQILSPPSFIPPYVLLPLRNFYKSEEIFLDMFEDEWREMNKRPMNVEYVMSDASLLLPPTGDSSS